MVAERLFDVSHVEWRPAASRFCQFIQFIAGRKLRLGRFAAVQLQRFDAKPATSSSQSTYQTPSPSIYSTYNMSGQQQQQGQAGSQDSSTQDQQQDSSTQAGGGSDTLPGTNDDTSGLGGPQATFTHPEKLPALNLFSDAVAHTGYSFNASGGIVGQYLGGYSGEAGYWQTLFIGTGGLSIVQVRPHLLWTVGYSRGREPDGGNPWAVFQFLNSEPEREWPHHVADRQALAVSSEGFLFLF